MAAFVTPLLLNTAATSRTTTAFTGTILHVRRLALIPRRSRGAPPAPARRTGARSTPCALLGGGGFLGVGPAEVVVIAAVGWLLLGPEKLYALAKDMGRTLGELRRTANDARDTFKDALEFEMEEGAEGGVADDEGRDRAETVTAAAAVKGVGEAAENDDVDALSGAPTAETLAQAADGAASRAPADDGASAAFLQQLQRVADPEQEPLSDVPNLDIARDIDAEIEEELRVEELERKYLEAKAQLEQRKYLDAKSRLEQRRAAARQAGVPPPASAERSGAAGNAAAVDTSGE